jgi:ParB family chromosome partitioning protein
MNMRMNLTGLADLANAQLANKGRPLELALGDVLPDPDNPRSADAERSAAAVEAQEELDGDVASRGVKSPISVRPHPNVPGKFIINYGHRRYKAAHRSNLATIPAFIDEKFDSYDQVNENELRTGLTTRERALFIKGRLDAGDSKGEIAERMRKRNQTFITEHLALIDAPECVNRAYAAGVTSARTLYDLRQAWQAFPAAVEAWCRNAAHISRDAIRDALAGFRHDEAGAATAPATDISVRPAATSHHDEEALRAAVSVSPKDVKEFRHDEKLDVAEIDEGVTVPHGRTSRGTMGHSGGPDTPSEPVKQVASAGGVLVRYKGKLARISRDVVVPIALEDSDDVLTVPLSALVFK